MTRIVRALLAPFAWLFRLFLTRQIAAARVEAERLPPGGNKLEKFLSPPVPVPVGPTREQELDFLEWRSLTYVEPMTFGVADELALALTGKSKPEAFDEKTLATMARQSALAYLTHREGSETILDFGATTMFPYTPMTVSQFRFDLERERFTIFTVGGRRHEPGDPLWETAVTHAMGWATQCVPAAAHNWVHFAFPDACATAWNELASKDSTVARLIAPHVRFTNRINWQALWVQRGSSHGPSLRKQLIPWMAMPFDAEHFRGGILHNTQEHYRNLSGHFEIPTKLDRETPYFRFLHAYYEVVERFVARLEPSLEDDAWAEFARGVDEQMPGFAAIPRVKALAVLLWQAGVVHLCDHLSFFPYAFRHGFTHLPANLEKPFTRHHVSWFSRWKMRNFLKTWVDFNPSPGLDLRLLNIDAYGFEEGTPARQAALAFRADLLAQDAKLASEGLQFVPVDRMIQSVCF